MAGVTDRLGRALNRPLARAVGATAPTERPRSSEPPRFRPHAGDRLYGFSHYNVVIPSLPEPHRFLACAVLIGRTGMRAFDAAHVHDGRPDRTATVAFGTAATAPSWFESYSAARECELAPDGSLLRFGDGNLTLSGLFPSLTLTSSRPGFEVALDLALTDEATWFVRSPIYQHLGLPARAVGSVGAIAVDALASVEYARAVNLPALLRGRTLPWNFFTYHVVELDPDTLLLLTHTRALGQTLLTTAFVKTPGGKQRRIVSGVSLTLGDRHAEPRIAPDAARTSIPMSFRWSHDELAFELEGVPDTEMIYGIGAGWIGGLRYRGVFDGCEVDARGYFEYIDRR